MNKSARGWLGLGLLVVVGLVILLARTEPKPPLHFNRDIAPMVHTHCSTCHRPGQPGPFDLLTYADVKKRGRQLAEVCADRYMPPWLPEPGYGEFKHARVLTARQIADLRRWVDEGMVEGDPAERPDPPVFTEGWQLGPPDLVLRASEAFALPPEGPDVYRNLVVPVPVDATRFVRAIEVRPGNASVHHIVIWVDEGGGARLLDERQAGAGFDGMELPHTVHRPGGIFLGWNPGRRVPEQDVSTWVVQPGTDLVLQTHMQCTGKPESVQPEVGLYFSEQPPSGNVTLIDLFTTDIRIPAGRKRHTIEVQYVLPVDVAVTGIAPHLHYIGRKVEVWAEPPAGKKTWLLKINDWDFNWQGEYSYVDPVVLPAGSAITQRCTYDNSEDNPRNPHHPPREVRYGPQTTDEMAELWLQLRTPDPADLPKLRAHHKAWKLEFIRAEMAERLARRGGAPDEWLLGAKLHMAANDHAAAEPLLQKIIENGWEDELAEAHYLVGWIQENRGAFDEAEAEWRKALAADEAYLAALHAIGLSLSKRNQREEARKRFLACVERDPKMVEALLSLGMMAFEDGFFENARSRFEQVLALRWNEVEALNGLGSIHANAGDFAAARTYFEQAVNVDPSHPHATRNLEKLRQVKAP